MEPTDVDDEMVELGEDSFLTHGEPDPEFEHILHYDRRVFDFITKDIGLLSEAEKFCDNHNHMDLDGESYNAVLEGLKQEMELTNNPNS